ncbi:MAG: hypothetical protein M3377_09700 [Actinomycetota bacterium]|nr:hypothetical protein [Actinomycetota bacterium]
MSADALAAAIDLEPAGPASCPLCIFAVVAALKTGDENEIQKALRFFVPLLWDEGLSETLKSALERARKAGIVGTAAAIADLDARGYRSLVAEAVVRRLAGEQLEEMERNRTASLN